MITKYIKGSIADTELSLIAHGVNCQGVMGSGVAKVLLDKWPVVKEKYLEHYNASRSFDKKRLLADVGAVVLPDERIVLNCFTQVNYGYDKKKYVSYYAIAICFDWIATLYPGQKIAIPKIGCGLAGGDWNVVSALIDDAVGDKLEVWVYEI